MYLGLISPAQTSSGDLDSVAMAMRRVGAAAEAPETKSATALDGLSGVLQVGQSGPNITSY